MRERMLAVWALVLLTSCSAIIDPDVARFGSGPDGAASGMDAGRDGPRGSDARTIETDAPSEPDAEARDAFDVCVTCAEGEVCTGVACVCPEDACCPPCASGSSCVDAACVPCGSVGEACCPERGCTDGSTCVDRACVERCGDPGEPCCGERERCAPGAACTDAGFLGTRRECAPCGSVDQPCCDGACAGDDVACVDERCRRCGRFAQPCCPGDVCRGETTCRFGYCA